MEEGGREGERGREGVIEEERNLNSASMGKEGRNGL